MYSKLFLATLVVCTVSSEGITCSLGRRDGTSCSGHHADALCPVSCAFCPFCLAGRIPPELGKLGALLEIDLSYNQLSGETLDRRALKVWRNLTRAPHYY